MTEQDVAIKKSEPSFLDKIIRFCLENPLVVCLLIIFFFGWGLYVMPFEWDSKGFPTNPVPVDAIPDIGENQQIIFTRWPGRSPQDVEDQVTYPMTVAMLGVPGVKEVRSFSIFGFSSVNVIFKEEIDFYWSRSRILEKLAVAQKELPPDVVPELGPDATGLGQIFWYTLEGKEWGLEELRSIQDWVVNYALESADGVSEVASIGGYVKEYQVDVDPDAMRAHRVSLAEVVQAVKGSNIDVGARTIEVNNVEYVVRGIGYIKKPEDLMNTVIKESNNVPIYVSNVANVSLGPALRRGVLDKEGAEVVGGVAVVRYGENPLHVIKEVKSTLDRIGDKEIVDGKETWILRGYEKTLSDGSVSKVRLVPFYDRTQLIQETLGTLQQALSEEVLITIIIVVVMLSHFMSSLLISSTLPFAVLISFICMKSYGVDANIMSLSGIAIAIGTMVDMGIILCENIVSALDRADDKESRLEVIYGAASEVGSAVVTAISTTVVSFLPVFTMIGAEGKMFKPLAYTKTFALLASVMVALTIIPTLAMFFLAKRKRKKGVMRNVFSIVTILLGIGLSIKLNFWVGLVVVLFGGYRVIEPVLPGWTKKVVQWGLNIVAIVAVALLLTNSWMPLGPVPGFLVNLFFVVSIIAVVLGGFLVFQYFYPTLLRFFLDHKWVFYPIPLIILVFGLSVWLGFDKTIGVIPKAMDKMGLDGDKIRSTNLWVAATHKFPGLGKEFMPPLDEGTFLYMPTTMTHASLGECTDVISKQDRLINNIPEVETVVGKIGRVESALDPAPISMVETVINYKPEWGADPETGERIRNWRDHIKTPQDIWDEIVKQAQLPGSTAAPKLQPIETRLVMLQTGMRAPMGVKLYGPSLEVLNDTALDIERFLKEVPSIAPDTVIADRVVGKPYLEINIDREAIARYGVNIRDVQNVIEIAIGGMPISRTVEGRERYPVRVRYQRELRDRIEELGRILVPTMRMATPTSGSRMVASAVMKEEPVGPAQIPLSQVAKIEYVRGPQAIKSEDTFLVAYITFGPQPGFAEVDVVEKAQNYLQEKIKSGEFVLPAGSSYKFSGTYENQVRAAKTLSIVLPLALFIIFLILYLQFRSISTPLICWSGILIAWCGGFIMLWLYAQPWFLDFSIAGTSMRNLFQVHPINLSVAVWVGFIALFGIASDDGVVMATFLDQSFRDRKTESIKQIRDATLEGGMRRIRPCLMTTATTVLALLPVLTSQGRGSDVMVPMAIPSFGGMCIELITLFVVPVTYCWVQEIRFRAGMGTTGD